MFKYLTDAYKAFTALEQRVARLEKEVGIEDAPKGDSPAAKTKDKD